MRVYKPHTYMAAEPATSWDSSGRSSREEAQSLLNLRIRKDDEIIREYAFDAPPPLPLVNALGTIFTHFRNHQRNM